MLNTLQEHWLNHQIMGLDVIFNHGQIQMIDILWTENLELPHAFNKEYQLCYGEHIGLTELIEHYGNFWSEFQVNDCLELEDCFIFCGEGEMGNEGFIVKTNKNNILEWMLFSTSSNPFISIHHKNELIYIKSTHNFYIVFNVITLEVSVKHIS